MSRRRSSRNRKPTPQKRDAARQAQKSPEATRSRRLGSFLSGAWWAGIAGIATVISLGIALWLALEPSGSGSAGNAGSADTSIASIFSPSATPGITAPSAAASRGNYSDCTARHCYSIAISPSSMSGSPYQGARATMYLTYMRSGSASPSNPAYINSSLWVIQNSAHDAFMEVGIYDGWVGADNTRICTGNNSRPHCIHFIYEPGNEGSSECINSGCTAYLIYWADTNMSGATVNTFFHVVEFTSPSPGTQLYVDDGYNQGEWKVHIVISSVLNYYGTSTLNSRYQYVESIKVGGELDQVAKAGACADIESMTFYMWVPPETYEAFDAQTPATAHVDTSTFNGTQQVPGTNPGTWVWSVPATSNYNGC